MTHFHSIDPKDIIFCNNIEVSAGRITAMSLSRATGAAPVGTLSPYEAFTRERQKEEVFEAIRAAEFPKAPPRMGAIFLFGSEDVALAANQKWWKGQRVILGATIMYAHRQGQFDAALLDRPKDQWEEAARHYWSGTVSQTPQIEVLVDGVVQLIGWEPYGRRLSPGAKL